VNRSSSSVRVGNRIPREYFVTSGKGESDITVHAGSYHLALRDAGIEWANQITYSSILPGTAVEIDRPSPIARRIVHGEVMETITATATCQYGETTTAGLIWGWLHDPHDHSRYGGLVCEYNGPLVGDAVEDHLKEMLQELYLNGYDGFRLEDITIRLETIAPIKMYGTALVALCFVSYDVPLLIEPEVSRV
jgi:arginine decarboxylase